MERRKWMYEIPRHSHEYISKLSEFIKVADADRVKKQKEKAPCPCKKCQNFNSYADLSLISQHLIVNGFVDEYDCWSWHGETLVDNNNNVTYERKDDVNDENIDSDNDDYRDNLDDMFHDLEGNIDETNYDKFQQVLTDSEIPLYDGCTKFTKLSAVLKLVNLKAKNNWSDKSFTSLLELLHEMLPEDNELPVSYYRAKKIMCPMGLEIERIHACPNDCILYRNENKDLHECYVCGASRYKQKNQTEVESDVTKNGPPAKLLWYFPIIPRLKRLFASPKDAKLLRWHAEERKNDGKLRHVADSSQWRNIDNIYTEFGNEVRNIRVGLSSDGINPFGNMSSRHSTWPVLLCIYNLPPWLCMKRKYIMMSLLIQGPKQPGNDIDVYLAPLIEDLQTLWNPGVQVYDAYMKENFNLRCIIFCTISDFPAYGNLSGYSTKGMKACPICESETCSIWLKNCKKPVFMGHRKGLPISHPYRMMGNLFDGNDEVDSLRPPLDGEATFSKVKSIDIVFGKSNTSREKGIWKKRSIFWDLPYWKHLHVRHCIDVMHIEKNVCDSLIGLLLNIPGKTKDGLNVRNDMVEMKVRSELHPKNKEAGKRPYLPVACYTLSKVEKGKFCQCLHGVKVPSGYSANIKRLVSLKDNKLIGMKSHDCHVMMTQMIPIAIRGILPDRIRHTITKLCLFFNVIHSKVIDPAVLDTWQSDIILTLCQLEMYFPPSFFDVMVHLVSHIVYEIKACGPVFLRYMYPFRELHARYYEEVKNRPPNVKKLYKDWKKRENPSTVGITFRTDQEIFGNDDSPYSTMMPDDIMGLLTNRWLDISIITWFSVVCYKLQQKATLRPQRCAFVNPYMISQDVCAKASEQVISHIKSVIHDREKFYILPYHQQNHWTLFILSFRKKRGYILDSMKGKKVAHDYLLTKLVDRAFGSFLWDLPLCQQQRSDWECGYYVMKWMHQFILYEQYQFDNNVPWNIMRPFSEIELNEVLDSWISATISLVKN